MKAKIAGAALAVLLMGCHCHERYSAFLGQVEENLREDVRPKYEKALRESGRPDDLVDNDLKLLDDTIESLRRVREEGVE